MVCFTWLIDTTIVWLTCRVTFVSLRMQSRNNIALQLVNTLSGGKRVRALTSVTYLIAAIS